MRRREVDGVFSLFGFYVIIGRDYEFEIEPMLWPV